MMPRRAWWAAFLALVCMACGCASTRTWAPTEDDRFVDEVWAALRRRDLDGAGSAIGRIQDELFAQRARRDLQAVRESRAAALVLCLEQGSWMAARFRASTAAAWAELGRLRRRGSVHAAVWLECCRCAPDLTRRLSAASAVRQGSGGAEARAVLAEALLDAGRLGACAEVLQRSAGLPTARLRLARRKLDARSGRLRAAAEGLLEDLDAAAAVPESLTLLERVLQAEPLEEIEQRATALLARWKGTGGRMERARRRLGAWLAARAGQTTRALALLGSIEPRLPAEERLLERWQARQDPDPARVGEAAAGAGPSSPQRWALRLAHEWSLRARASYRAALQEGEVLDLDPFLEQLDDAARPLGEVPHLARLPRRDFGVLGEMLDSEALMQALPGSFIMAGRALGRPAELTWYDLVRRRTVSLPGEDGSYDEFLVRQERVPGFSSYLGAGIVGAGLERLVYLDLDRIELEEILARHRPLGPALDPLPARGPAGRRDLSEPLDVVARLQHAAAVAAGAMPGRSPWLASAALHERRHILDAKLFLRQGMGARLLSLLGAGLLPGAVRAEIELRAQLHALRHAPDPRVPLAQMVAAVPLDASRRPDEHALGYTALLARFLAVLDAGAYEGARPLAELGLDPQGVLVQQLHRLDPEAIRAVAEALGD